MEHTNEEINKIKSIIDLIDRENNPQLGASDIKKVRSQIAFRNESGQYTSAIEFAKKIIKHGFD